MQHRRHHGRESRLGICRYSSRDGSPKGAPRPCDLLQELMTIVNPNDGRAVADKIRFARHDDNRLFAGGEVTNKICFLRL